MSYKEPKGLSEQIDALRTIWSQAHYEPPKSGIKHDWHLILLPGFYLAKGWNKTICTVLFLARIGEPTKWCPRPTQQSSLDGFYVDLPDLRLLPDMAMPQYARPFALANEKPRWHEPTKSYSSVENLPGFPQWRDLTRFWWHSQMHDPNHHTLFTTAMMIRQRLNPAR